MYFDTHAHYDADAFDEDRLTLLASLPESQISYVLNPGCDLPSSKTAISLSEKFPFFYAAVGIHPSECGFMDREEKVSDTIQTLRELAHHEKVKAIGEIGLDFYWETNPPAEVQSMVFHGQMSLAEELNLPVIIHDREAHEACLKVIQSHKARGVYHCYSGSVEHAKILLDLGYMMSFTGVITYKNARKTLEVLEYLPMESIMLETDSPYLSPVPMRGKRNDSRNLCYMAQVLADIKGISLEECGRITTENGLRFFDIQ